VFGQIDDIGVAFTSRKFFKLQVVVTISVVGKLDYTAETVFPIIVQRGSFFGMDFFDLCGYGIFVLSYGIGKKLLTFCQAF
jgi:hypothetical protein